MWTDCRKLQLHPDVADVSPLEEERGGERTTVNSSTITLGRLEQLPGRLLAFQRSFVQPLLTHFAFVIVVVKLVIEQPREHLNNTEGCGVVLHPQRAWFPVAFFTAEQ